MNLKLLTRLLCALLSVLMLVCMIPAMTISAEETVMETVNIEDYVSTTYQTAEERLAAMTPVHDNGTYTLYVDKLVGDVAYKKNATGEIMFTNPWDSKIETNQEIREPMLSQITLSYLDSKNNEKNLTSYADAVLKGQMSIKPIKNGVRVEYAIGERSARTLVPQMIERSAFEQKILTPLAENAGPNSSEYRKLKAYFNEMFYMQYLEEGRTEYAEAVAMEYPVTSEKGIDIYVLQYNLGTNVLNDLESWIMEYCPEYTFEEMDNDHAEVGFEEESISPPVFKMALEYVLDETGLVVTLPANGLRYDETSYRITDLTVLPYMGACNTTSEGYSFLPDGSGTLYDLGTMIPVTGTNTVYGKDYAMGESLKGDHSEIIRMPVFGQVETETLTNLDGSTTDVSRGFLGIIESGESLATITVNHQPSIYKYSYISLSFITRPSDVAGTGNTTWNIYADRRYVDDYQIRYVMLSDDQKAEAANLSSYYECSWMGMACAYRDYLDANVEGFDRISAEEAGESIPLYIESFGAVDSIEKVLSMPVTVSVPLTTFENVATMYDYLAGEGVTNVNFKLTGFANGGVYSEMPYKLKWEKSVGGKSGFEDLTRYAAEKGFMVYPDFDFVYTTSGEAGGKVNAKKNFARTIENRYTTKRIYSATKQSLVSYFQMVMAPETYSKFYEKLEKKYSKYENATGISLSTFGNALNSDFDEDKTTLREESKEYVIQALEYFGEKYSIMLDGGNAYTWAYADHIINVPLDSSRYYFERNAVPFLGVVLHGYVEFAGTPLNKEGDLGYAMLKAMENGAAVYFILSYANTELLKEDVLLSQNYSVRYDIWQNRLVEIYKELNEVLADVQSKLIIDHNFLEGTRVPDEDELLQDILDEANKKAEEIEDKIDADHQAAVTAIRNAVQTAANAAAKISSMTDFGALLNAERANVTTSSNKYLLTNWQTLLDEMNAGDTPGVDNITADTLEKFTGFFRDSVISRIVTLRKDVVTAAETVIAAKEAYEYLISVNAVSVVVADAKTDLEAAVDAFEAKAGQYMNDVATADVWASEGVWKTEIATTEELLACVTFAGAVIDEVPTDRAVLEDYIMNADSVAVYNFGAEEYYRAFVNLLIAQGLYNPEDAENSKINVKAMEDALSAPPVEDEEDEIVEEEETATVNTKYAIDGDIVVVTYGEAGAPFKSMILNFNDYAVETSWNGVTYTVDAYGYVVIYH